MKKALLAPLVLILFVSFPEASKYTAVQGLRHATYTSYTRVVVDINGPIEFTKNRLSNPDRIYFDLINCSLPEKIKSSHAIDDRVLKSVRMAQFNEDTVRVVFDLKELKNYYAFMLENPYRLVIDVYAGKKKSPSRKEKKHKKVRMGNNLQEIKTVVIDPGHGGKDPGAVGPGGLREKDIALYVGKRLGHILKKRHGINVIYTRDRDVFVPLNERTELANRKKADLFISIHTNSSEQRKVRGIETYFLNWTNNREALRVAARENKVSLKKMKQMQDGLQAILQDLARNNKREESMRLAHSVQNAMVDTLKRDYRMVEDLGVKYALFYVLVGAEMPSILVEISFISNREEERRLATRSYKNKIAEAIARGIDSYVAQSTLIVKPVTKQLPIVISQGVKGTGDGS